MAPCVKDIVKTLNLEAPFRLAESWDNVGLLVGTLTVKLMELVISSLRNWD